VIGRSNGKLGRALQSNPVCMAVTNHSAFN